MHYFYRLQGSRLRSRKTPPGGCSAKESVVFRVVLVQKKNDRPTIEEKRKVGET